VTFDEDDVRRALNARSAAPTPEFRGRLSASLAERRRSPERMPSLAAVAAVVLAGALFSGPHQQLIMTTAAFFAVLGHLFPVWLKFRGGKGVATSLGAFILLTPKSILCMVFLFLLIAVAFRYVSLGSIAVAAAFPLLAWALHEYADSRQPVLIALVSALVIWRHRQNIRRLTAGTESKLGKAAGSESKSESESESTSESISKLEKSGTLGATRR